MQKVRKSLLQAFALSAVLASVDLLKAFSLSNNSTNLRVFYATALISDSVQLFCSIVCVSLILFYSIQTAKFINNFKPVEGARNFAETVDLMKRLYRLTVQVLILNSVMILVLLLYDSLVVIRDLHFLFVSNLDYYDPGFFDTLNLNISSSFYLSDWSPHFTIFTSNIGLFVHTIFSRAYRNEVIKIFRQFKGIFGCKYTGSVSPSSFELTTVGKREC